MPGEFQNNSEDIEGEPEEILPEDYENMMGENLDLMKEQLVEKKDELETLKNKKRPSKKDTATIAELMDTIALMEEEINNREDLLG